MKYLYRTWSIIKGNYIFIKMNLNYFNYCCIISYAQLFYPKKIIEKNHHPSKLFNYSLIEVETGK